MRVLQLRGVDRFGMASDAFRWHGKNFLLKVCAEVPACCRSHGQWVRNWFGVRSDGGDRNNKSADEKWREEVRF